MVYLVIVSIGIFSFQFNKPYLSDASARLVIDRATPSDAIKLSYRDRCQIIPKSSQILKDACKAVRYYETTN